MATAAQIVANQQNAAHSTGPRSEAGKDTVSRNAVVHRLCAQKFFLSPDEKPLFDQMRAALAEHYQPVTAHELGLLEELAEARWRARLARTMEAALLDAIVAEQRKADPTLTPTNALTRLFIDDTLQKRMRLMMRYLGAAERSAEKARNELERVIAIRLEEEQRAAQRQRLLAMHAPLSPAPVSPQPDTPAAASADRLCSAAPPNR